MQCLWSEFPKRLPTEILTENQFAEAYRRNAIATSIYSATEFLSSPDKLIPSAICSCSDILDYVAPIKYRHPKLKSHPWLGDSTRFPRHACQKAERRWIKDHLSVSFKIFKNRLANLQTAAKKARAKYFSEIISKHSHRPKFLQHYKFCPQSPYLSQC